MEATNLSTQLHLVRIKVLKGLNPYDAIESLSWSGLPNALMIKYRWYFEYRQALLKVKYPKNKVTLERHTYQPQTSNEKEQARTRLKNLAAARQRKITEISRKIAAAKKDWRQLFPIEEHPHYSQAKSKLYRLQTEKAEYEQQLKKL